MTRELVGVIVICIGLVFSLAGVVILYAYKGFYIKAAATSLIDSAGFILIVIGIIIYSGWDLISLKVFFLLLFAMILNPLSNHYIVKGAYRSGFKDDISD